MREIIPILSFLRVLRSDTKPGHRVGFLFSGVLELQSCPVKVGALISGLEKELMRQFFAMTFGGLTPSYYLRHLFFGVLLAAVFGYMKSRAPSGIGLDTAAMGVISTLLYPYSRFVYESVVGFVVGQNVFFFSARMMLAVKAVTMLVCWFLAVFIAPLGLAYLYWYHSRQPSN